MTPWIYLIGAGLFEVGFTTFLKLSQNFTHWLYTGLFGLSACISFLLLSMAIKSIPMGTAYAVWTGIGAAGTAVIGIIFYQEPSDGWRLFFLSLLIFSLAGLKFVSPHD